MFESATTKLTLIYMGILTLICLFFSYNWYTIATAELDRGFQRQKVALEGRPRFIDREIVDEILLESKLKYTEAQEAILNKVILTNIIIISAGTLGSYLLARRSLKPIEEAHREQIRFTADASHELRTPLASMQTEIEVALRDPQLGKKEAVELLHSNIEELAKLASLSEGLLKLARQDESVAMQMQTVSLEALIDKAVTRVQKAAKHKKITLVHEVTEAKVSANFNSITDLLVILLDNAIKYSPEKTKVSIVSKATKSHVAISVTDMGTGIRQVEQSKIFERFYRADSSRSSQNANGHGLGLAIAKNISDIHDANLSVQSEGTGMGSTFTFRLAKPKS